MMVRCQSMMMVLMLLMLGGHSASAHTLWLFSSSYLVELSGEDHIGPHPFSILYGWGHQMPVDDQLSKQQVDRMVVSVAGGPVEQLEPGPENAYLTTGVKPTTPGVYVIGAGLKPYLFTRYHDGDQVRFEFVGKDGIPDGVDVITSRYTTQFAKTIVNVGSAKPEDAPDQQLGFDVEIVLGAHPSAMKPNDDMPFTIYFHGQPLDPHGHAVVVELRRLGFAGVSAVTIDDQGHGLVGIPDTGVYQLLVAIEENGTPEMLKQSDGTRLSCTSTFACTQGINFNE